MSDRMFAIPFELLMQQLLQEYRENKTVFQVKTLYQNEGESQDLKLFGRRLEWALGVAAGPHTQLAQNLAACYAGGARFLEVKTIQKLYGEDLGIPRPCIRADDEAYNVEWSSEFKPFDAAAEYIKGYFLCKVLAKEFGFGDPDAFMFNISCGYDYEGLKDPSVDEYLNLMQDATHHPEFARDLEVLKNLQREGAFEQIDEAFIDQISPKISNTLTLSTMHGCPPDEIEKMARHILEVKGLNLYVKCNPTLLGYDYVRDLLDRMGYDYVRFGREQFEKDLKPEQAFEMFERLLVTAKERGLTFGVKLTNTFQTDIEEKELPGQSMYMSGKALYPLSISVAKLLSARFGDRLPMSFSGGADAFNLKDLLEANIYPITVCTVLLKPRGMNQLAKLAQLTNETKLPAHADERGPKADLIAKMADEVAANTRYQKSAAKRKQVDLHKSYVGVRSDDIHCRVLCQSCIDVCPNRANDVLSLKDDARVILHIDQNCNECGNCQFHCVEPCLPYRDRLTLFHHEDELLQHSENKGVCFLDGVDGDRFAYRYEGEGHASYAELPEVLQKMVDAIRAERRYLL